MTSHTSSCFWWLRRPACWMRHSIMASTWARIWSWWKRARQVHAWICRASTSIWRGSWCWIALIWSYWKAWAGPCTPIIMPNLNATASRWLCWRISGSPNDLDFWARKSFPLFLNMKKRPQYSQINLSFI